MKMELKEFKSEVLPLRQKLLNYARKLTDSSDDAEDIVQEVLLKLWSSRDKLEQYHSVEAFAMTVVHHSCMDWWRTRHWGNLSLEQLQTQAADDVPDLRFEQKDEVQLIRQIIRLLPALQQTIIRMKDIEEYETEEIAEITGCTPVAIRSNLSRARKRVKELYLQAIQQKRRRNTL